MFLKNLGEAPRELIEGGIFFSLGFVIAHVKFSIPAKRRHQELLQRHDEHQKQLKEKC